MPKIAWAKQLYNAYNHIKKNDKVYTETGEFLGTANGYCARCTATSPGSVQVGDSNGYWISGDVEKKNNDWYMTSTCKLS